MISSAHHVPINNYSPALVLRTVLFAITGAATPSEMMQRSLDMEQLTDKFVIVRAGGEKDGEMRRDELLWVCTKS